MHTRRNHTTNTTYPNCFTSIRGWKLMEVDMSATLDFLWCEKGNNLCNYYLSKEGGGSRIRDGSEHSNSMRVVSCQKGHVRGCIMRIISHRHYKLWRTELYLELWYVMLRMIRISVRQQPSTAKLEISLIYRFLAAYVSGFLRSERENSSSRCIISVCFFANRLSFAFLRVPLARGEWNPRLRFILAESTILLT